MKKSLPMKERITVTRRGFLLLNSYCPGLLKDKTLYAFAAAIQPLASIWISAQIINELTETRRIPVLFEYVAAVIGTNFIVQLLKNVLNKAAAEKEAQMWNFFEKIFSDKAMSLDYADLEKDQVQQARKEAHENLFLRSDLSRIISPLLYLVKRIHCDYSNCESDRYPHSHNYRSGLYQML